MQKKQFILLVAFCISFVAISAAQKRYTIRNGIGLTGGLTQYDIATDNFTTKSGNGFIGGMIATVDIPHKWYTVSYGFQFSQNSLEIMGRPAVTAIIQEPLDYKIMAVQATFLLHVKLLSDNVTIDLGPQIQYNGELELKNGDQKNYIVDGFDGLLAEDISDISKFNVNGVIGASAGIGRFKLRAAYSYGFTNILNKLNDKNLTTTPNSKEFEGNQTILSFSVLITL